ncbi:MAG: hypothetical protein LIR46_12070 [Bacteroidota bacterium]|nr:hypothetical protein [Bacteroidota bacterium]
MKKHNKITLGLAAGMFVTALTVFGSTAGTLAWYVYSRTTRVNFVGTSVAKSALLNVGIVDDNHYLTDEKVAEYELTREEYDGHSIVFTHKVDGIDYHVIQDYLFAGGQYAVSMLLPLTTQERAISDANALALFESPTHGDTIIDTTADTHHYVKLPLAFRMDNGSGESVHDENIWLTDVKTQATGKNIHQALRVFVENSQRKLLMKPADMGTAIGKTAVGGPLDLDGDGTYYYDGGTHLEHYYGQFSGYKEYSSDPYGIPKETAPYDNVNDVTDLTESTFYSKHNEDAKILDYTKINPVFAEYYPFGYVKPQLDSEGKYIEGTTGFKIACTDSTDGVGYVTFTIYIEGWDHVVIDQASNYSFNLSMKFETDKD